MGKKKNKYKEKERFSLSQNTMLLMLIVSVLVFYSLSFNNSFHYDDFGNIEGNPLLYNLDNFAKFSYWSHINTRPLSFFTFALNYSVSGYSVFSYHLVNIAIHIISTILVFFIFKTMFSLSIKKEDESYLTYAFFTALIFALHPLQVQAVTYIVQRMTSMAGMFYLLSVFLYIKGRLITKEWERGKAILLIIASILSMVLAFLSKQSALSLPASLLLCEVFFIRNKQGKINKSLVYIFSLSLIIIILSAFFLGVIPKENERAGRLVYFATQWKVLLFYLRLFFIPIGQSIDHNFVAVISALNPLSILSLIVLLTIASLGVWFFKRDKIISFSIFWFFITLSVESTIIPIRDVCVEHRMYLPVASLSALLVRLVFIASKKFDIRKTHAIIFIVVLSFLYGAKSFERNIVWQNEKTLWEDVRKKYPSLPRPYITLGSCYFKEGNYEKALEYYGKALDLEANSLHALYNIGTIYATQGQYEEATEYLERALLSKNDYLPALNNLAGIYLHTHKYAQAENILDRILDKNPYDINALNNKGALSLLMGESDEAISYLEKVLAIEPQNKDALVNLSIAKASQTN